MLVTTMEELETALNQNEAQVTASGDAAGFLNWTDDSRVKPSHSIFKYKSAEGLQRQVRAAKNFAKNNYGQNTRDKEMRKIVLDHYDLKLTRTAEIDLTHK